MPTSLLIPTKQLQILIIIVGNNNIPVASGWVPIILYFFKNLKL